MSAHGPGGHTAKGKKLLFCLFRPMKKRTNGEKNDFSARATHSCIKLARTIADMKESYNIELQDLKEAVSYRKNEGGINYCF